MGAARFGDAAVRTFRAARVLGRDQAHVGHETRRDRNPTRVAELRRNGEGGQVVDATKAARSRTTRARSGSR